MNIVAIIVAALVPNIIGFLWYNPKVFGNTWMKETGLTFNAEDRGKGMVKILIISLVLSFMIALTVMGAVIHQNGLYSLIQGNQEAQELVAKGSAIELKIGDKIFNVADNFRTFKHGVFHGIIMSIFFVLPLVAISAMYEKRSWKYIMISTGYWMVNLAIMGGIISAWK